MSTYHPAGTQPARPPDAGPAIEVTDLVKTYGKREKAVRALTGLSFSVPAGAVFGLLGPNGAGKSTTVRILTTLAAADSGRASVAGLDVDRQAAQVRQAIGYVPQRPCFDPTATGRENLTLQGHIYGMSSMAIRGRSDELLQRFGLTDAADRITKTWSGGMQRKLDVALALIHEPRVLFLDEPTTGLDPEARAELWTEISGLADTTGLTVLLTTHYLEEADHLADQLAIVDRGAIVAAGTPDELKGQLEGDTIQIQLADPEATEPAVKAIDSVDGVQEINIDDDGLHARVIGGAATLPRALATLEQAGVVPSSVTVARPSLDDVYLRYAGRSFRSADDAGAKEEN